MHEIRQARIPLLVFVAVLLVSGCQTLDTVRGQRTLAAGEVRSLFVGKTVESYNLNNGTTSYTYYRKNGVALQVRNKKRRRGKWHIRKDGMICLNFTGLKCRHIVERRGSYYKVRKNRSGYPKRIIHYKRFQRGNTLGFW